MLLIPRDFPHVVLTSLFISARYLWDRRIDFIEKGGGSLRRGRRPLVLNLDEGCYYYRFHLLPIKNEKDLTRHSFEHISSCTERFFDTVFSSFSLCLWKYGSAIRLWAECNLQGISIKPIVLSFEETSFGYLSFKCFPTSWVLFCSCSWPGISSLSKFREHWMSWLSVTECLVFWRWWHWVEMFWDSSGSPGYLHSEMWLSHEFGRRQCRCRPDENTGIFMNSWCCIAVVAEVQLAGSGGIMHNQQCCQFCWISTGVQCLFLIAEEGKKGLWAEGAAVSRWRQDRTLLSYSIPSIAAGTPRQLFCSVLCSSHQGEENWSTQRHQNSKEVHVCRLEQSWHYLTGFGRAVQPA